MLRHLARPLPLGRRGERQAARYLQRLGYTLLAGGHRSRYGEIDLIAVDHHGAGWLTRLRRLEHRRTLVFIEVKTRSSDHAGDPAAAVDEKKQRRITDSALAYLKAHHLLEYPARFDVVAIVWPPHAHQPASLKHLQNAFEPSRQWQFHA